MHAEMDSEDAPDQLEVLDEACLCAVLAQLPMANDLLVASEACKRLHRATRTSSLWVKHLYTDFGLCLMKQSNAAAGTSAQAEGGTMLLYKQLMQAKRQQRALPAEALCTDGGCDEPYSAYWAGNLFVPKRSIMYCSESNTRNVHVFARLCPDTSLQQPSSSTAAGDAAQVALEGSLQGVDQLPQHQQAAPQTIRPREHADRRRREFLLDRCTHSAKHLISPEVLGRHESQHQRHQQQQEGRSGVVQRLYPHMGWGRGADARMAAAAEALGTCSTQAASTAVGPRTRRGCEQQQPLQLWALQLLAVYKRKCSLGKGLADFFMAAYMRQQQMAPHHWSLALFNNLTDEQIQRVHEVAFRIWAKLATNPTAHRFIQLPLPPAGAIQSSTGAAAARQQHEPAGLLGASHSSRRAGNGTVASRHGQQTAAQAAAEQQQQPAGRQLLCDEYQLCALSATTRPGQNLCVVREVILAREDGLSEHPTTCPVGSGMLFLGYYQHTSDTPPSLTAATHEGSSNSSIGPALPAPGSEARAAVDAAATAAPEAKAAAAALGSMTQQPWIAAANDLTTVSAVLTASCAGLLPPVLEHAIAGGAHYIEFAQPSREQLRQQQHEWARIAGTSAVNVIDGSSNGNAGLWPAAGFMVPVLWFRFPAALVVEAELHPVEGAAQGPLWDPAGDEAVPAPNSDTESQSSQAPTASDAQPSDGGQFESDAPDRSDTIEAEVTTGPTAAAQWLQTDASASADTSAASRSSSAATAVINTTVSFATTAASYRTVPAEVVCDQAEMLPAVATEVAAALGWRPSWPHHKNMLYIPLQQPRAANLMCVKLLDCEDVKPSFNRSRGGCNIDMQLVMLRGNDLGGLPAGFEVAPPELWPS